MTLTDDHILKLAGSALLGGVSPQDFRQYLEVLREQKTGEAPATPKTKAGNKYERGVLIIDGRKMEPTRRVAELIAALAKDGGVMTQEAIAKAMGNAPETTVYPTVSMARDMLDDAGLDKGLIITHPAVRGSGDKARYQWSPDCPLDIIDN